MAYAIDPQQKQNDQPQGTSSIPVPTSSAPGAGPTGSKTPTGVASNQQSAQPFTNLQAYLSANAPQVAQQANTIATGLTNQYGQVQNDINSGVGQFNQQVQGGYTPENASVVQQAAANPTQFASDPNNVKAFQSQLNDQYTGPTNFEGTAGYQSLNNEVTQDAANANLVNTPAGLQTYLQQSEVNPTQGENTLDSVLLQSSPDAIQQVTKAAQPFSQLPQYLSSQVATADQGVTAGQTGAQQAATNAAAAMNPVVSDFRNTISGLVPAAQTKQNAYNAEVAQNQQALNPLNTAYNSFNSGTTIPLSNPLTQYLNEQAMVAPASLPTIATSPQYAEDAALAQLMGQSYNSMLDQANVGQAGTFNVPAGLGITTGSTQAQNFADELLAFNKGNGGSPIEPLNYSSFGTKPGGGTAYNAFLSYLQSLNPNSVAPDPSQLLKGIIPLIPT